MNKVFIFAYIILLTACTLDYSDADIVENLSDEIPNTIIYKYETVEIQNGSPILKITADKAEVYDNKEETYLNNVDFYNFKEDEINNHGSSEYAVLKMKSGDAQLSGSILIESLEDETFLKAETLFWIDSEKRLSSNDEDYVTVKDEDGSQLSGKGFSADIKKKSIFFEGNTEGKYNSDEN